MKFSSKLNVCIIYFTAFVTFVFDFFSVLCHFCKFLTLVISYFKIMKTNQHFCESKKTARMLVCFDSWMIGECILL